MLNITGLSADRIGFDDYPSKDAHNMVLAKRKNPYAVLAMVSRWTIVYYHLQSILIGIWILFKWQFQFLWSLIHRYSLKYPKHTKPIEPNYRHDKPPPCLVDNRIGLQSYVKLKVSGQWKFIKVIGEIIRFIKWLIGDVLFSIISVLYPTGNEVTLHWGR